MSKNIKAGIYEIRNQVNNNFYIGSSNHIWKRWWEHRKKLRLGIHHCAHLQNAWSFHGENSFVFTIVEAVEQLEDAEALNFLLKETEQKYLDMFWDGGRNCYNVAKVADRPDNERNKIAVRQIDPVTKQCIKVWPSAQDVKRQLGICNINIACRGKVQSAGGFEWRYDDDELDAKFDEFDYVGKGSTNKKRVASLDVLGNIIAYSSIQEASRLTGINPAHISNCASGNRSSTAGILFYYEGEKIPKKKFQCLVCPASSDTLKGLTTHIQYAHNLSSKEYTIQYLYKGSEPKCLECGNEVRYVALSFKKYCKTHGNIAMSEAGKKNNQ